MKIGSNYAFENYERYINKIFENDSLPIADKTDNTDNTTRSDKGVEYIPTNDSIILENEDGIVSVARATSTLTNQQYQQKLSSLGFYSGPIDGVITSSVSQKAIRNFQRVYGLTENGTFNSSTQSKLDSVYSMFQNVYSSTSLATISSSNYFGLDSAETINFARTWTFLRLGMGLNSTSASGVMGNIYAESRFSSNNAYDRDYPGDHNSSYAYSTNDNIAYGLIQWCSSSRKQGLLTEANTMGLNVSDINAQFSYFKKEMASNSYSGHWNDIRNATSVNAASDIFLEHIEVGGNAYSARQAFSNTVYNLFYSY